MKNITILGSTGSIGINTLNVIDEYANEFNVFALAVNKNISSLEKQIIKYSPKIVCVFDEESAEILKKKLYKQNLKIVSGLNGLIEISTHEKCELLVNAMSGTKSIMPTIEAIKAKKDVAIANKEILVIAGEIVLALAKKNNVNIIPIDSEHSAIFQCLQNSSSKEVSRIIITASGGPFFKYPKEELCNIKLEQALNHPTYKMGKKITIDSSTLMNKGLEVIEAHFLFNLPSEKIDVIIHPQSIIHSFVEFIDGSILAQLSEPDMKIPIRYALNYPYRKKSNINACNKNKKNVLKSFDFIKNNALSFHKVDFDKFKCLKLAYDALKYRNSYFSYLNGANETLVERFLNNEILWHEISEKLDKLMHLHKLKEVKNLSEILQIDSKARKDALEI